jgi:hypothetical protein
VSCKSVQPVSAASGYGKVKSPTLLQGTGWVCFYEKIKILRKILRSPASSTQRIAKNTLMLYFRQILIMLAILYTVRIVLETLGAEDYGIYRMEFVWGLYSNI